MSSQSTVSSPSRHHGRRPAPRLRRALALCAAIAATHLLPPSARSAPLPQAHRDHDPAGRPAPTAAPTTSPLPLPSDTVLRVTFLDVGQGDAVLLQAPEGQTALVDAGPGDVVPLLREIGVERIDLLVASHPHADHIGGMARVIETMPVRFYMDNGDAHGTATYRRLMAALDARPGITYLEAVPRTISLGSAEIEALPLLPRGTADPNNRSVPLVVRFGDFVAFLSGDSEVRQLTDLVGRGAVPALTLLKAPHHGSDNGFTPAFLAAARPEVVVVSVGRNTYGHPRPAALRAYTGVGASVLRTDLHGHVAIRGHRSGGYEVDGIVAGGVAGDSRGAASAGTAAVGALSLAVHADAPGNDHDNPNGEYAVVENGGSADVAVGGWQLCDAANHCFRFPPGAVLPAGGQVFVHTGSGRSDGERYYMGRGRAVWNNNGDTATLRDGTGATVLVFRY